MFKSETTGRFCLAYLVAMLNVSRRDVTIGAFVNEFLREPDGKGYSQSEVVQSEPGVRPLSR